MYVDIRYLYLTFVSLLVSGAVKKQSPREPQLEPDLNAAALESYNEGEV